LNYNRWKSTIEIIYLLTRQTGWFFSIVMEQHPLPQDITGFEFKLVGDMTLKQFGYLAGGAILAVLFYFSGLPVFFKWPLVGFFAFLGVAFAFLPVEERPLDKWVANFIKAIYSLTLFIWKKKTAKLDFWDLAIEKPTIKPKEELKTLTHEERKMGKYLTSLPPKKDESVLGKREGAFLSKLDFSFGGETKIVKQAPEPQLQPIPVIPPTQEIAIDEEEKSAEEGKLIPRRPLMIKEEKERKPEADVAEKAQKGAVDSKISKIEEEMNQLKEKGEGDPDALWRIKELGIALQKAQDEKEKLKREIADLKKQKVEKHGVAPTASTSTNITKKRSVKYIGADQARTLGLPISPKRANIIGGIIKDKGGEILSDVIVVIKDKDDNPVRALKTNRVGQFMVATALPNGAYTFELEKDGYEFDIIEIELKGETLPALEIAAQQ